MQSDMHGCFPPVLQAASLKRRDDGFRPNPDARFSACFAGGLIEAIWWVMPFISSLLFSACFAGGLIEAAFQGVNGLLGAMFSACFAGGLIEAARRGTHATAYPPRFPPVLQAASLKLEPGRIVAFRGDGFSACFAGGLIEAPAARRVWSPRPRAFSACFAGGLIEARVGRGGRRFRGAFSACFAGGLIEAPCVYF